MSIDLSLSRVRRAFLTAADYIEAHPDSFDYWETRIPIPGERAGCALGWVFFFLGYRRAPQFNRIFLNTRGSEYRFYGWMLEREPDWNQNNKICAETLRLYVKEQLQETEHAV